MGRDMDDFKKLFPLLGNKYLFPNFPPEGTTIFSAPTCLYDSSNEDEQDKYFASTIMYEVNTFEAEAEAAQYPDEILDNIPKIKTDNFTDFDVVSFLSSDARSYLVRNDTIGTRFQVASLRGKKWVMICCFSCPIYYNSSEALDSIAVSHACSDLYASYGNSFEMVLVFKMRNDFLYDDTAFRHMLSGFPPSCLVVPFQDSHSRDSICYSLDFTTYPMGLFVLPDVGTILWKKSLSFFTHYGADTFPFTEEARENCDDKYIERVICPSLDLLLCSPPSLVLYKTPVGADSVIEVTSIKQIQKKLVGVYLCVNGNSIPELHQLYEDCKAKNIAFEVVVVYFAFHHLNPDPYLFIKLIERALHKRNISWWAYPFNSWISLKLSRLCNLPIEDELIIVGNGFLDLQATDFIRQVPQYDEVNIVANIDEFSKRYQTFLRSDKQRNVPIVRRTLETLNVYEGCMPTMSPHLFAEEAKNSKEAAGMDTNGNGCGDGRGVIYEPGSICEGSYLNVISFLSTHLQNSGGLVRCNSNKDKVGFNVLEDKVVMICCFSQPFSYNSPDIDDARSVSLAFPDLYAFGGFELVLVAHDFRHDPQPEEFDEFLSTFPSSCLAVPYSRCKAICDFFQFTYTTKPLGVLVNRNQLVEWCKPIEFFSRYGADAFPFTDDRLKEIDFREKNMEPWKNLCPLSSFLCSDVLAFPKWFNFLHKNPGGGPEKKPIWYLENRRVGLYVCQTGELIPTLGRVHKECCDSSLEFEIILVYLPFRHAGNLQSFQDYINNLLEEQNISLWVLPFVNWVSRRLWRLCHKDVYDRLIIIDPKSKFVELHGEAVISTFGRVAHPFSRKELINREFDRLKGVTLESLLVHCSRDYVVSKGTIAHPMGNKVPVAKLRGRNVFVYLGCKGDDHINLYNEVSCYNSRMKPPDHSFELVFVELDKSVSISGEVIAKPWLACPFDQEHSSLVSKKIFREGTGKRSTLIAFGTDGRIRSVNAQRHLRGSCSPFNDNLFDDVKTDIFSETERRCRISGGGGCCLGV